MKMNNLKKLLTGFMLCVCAVAFIAARGNFAQGNLCFFDFGGFTTLTVDTTTFLTGDVTASAGISTAGDITNSGAYIAPFDAVSLTSPTVTFSAAGIGIAQVTTDETQTGLTITGGTIGQILRILGTNDSATIQLTDGTSSMTLTGNLTLGLGDTATLLCTSTDGDEWSELSNGLN